MDQLMVQSVLDLDADWLRGLLSAGFAALRDWIKDGYDRAPALMAGLAVVVLVPALALAGALVTFVAAARRRAPGDREPLRTELAAARGLGWPCEAWLSVEGENQSRQAVPRELLSIGREDDNDLQLDHQTVHRHHALVHRNSDAQFLIQDLSGHDGNGVKLNGRRIERAMLADGDRIEIGAVTLLFEAHPA